MLRSPSLPPPLHLLLLLLPLGDPAVKVDVKCRHVKVSGKRGSLERSFRHVQLEFTMESPEKLRIDCWFGTKKVSRWRTRRRGREEGERPG